MNNEQRIIFQKELLSTIHYQLYIINYTLSIIHYKDYLILFGSTLMPGDIVLAIVSDFM
jgi:hypothetical protein